MAKIKVIRGGCGIAYKDEHGADRHALKTTEDGPFECDDQQAARLVSLGVAVYAEMCPEAVLSTSALSGALNLAQSASLDAGAVRRAGKRRVSDDQDLPRYARAR